MTLAVLLTYRCYRQVHVVKGCLRAVDNRGSLSESLWLRGMIQRGLCTEGIHYHQISGFKVHTLSRVPTTSEDITFTWTVYPNQ